MRKILLPLINKQEAMSDIQYIRQGFTKLVLVAIVGLLLMTSGFLFDFIRRWRGYVNVPIVRIDTFIGSVTWAFSFMYYLGMSLIVVALLAGLVLIVYKLFWVTNNLHLNPNSETEVDQLSLTLAPIELADRIARTLTVFFPDKVPYKDREGLVSVLHETGNEVYDLKGFWHCCLTLTLELTCLLWLVVYYRLEPFFPKKRVVP